MADVKVWKERTHGYPPWKNHDVWHIKGQFGGEVTIEDPRSIASFCRQILPFVEEFQKGLEERRKERAQFKANLCRKLP